MSKKIAAASVVDFDPQNIMSSPPVHVRKQVYYQGHAVPTYSVSQATNIIDFICKKFNSEDCAPFALKIIEGGQIISVAEDNGEFMCGSILSHALKKLEGYNVLVVVTRCVRGCFVTDMIQAQKRNYIKIAAEKAIEKLFYHLTNSADKENNSTLESMEESAPQLSLQDLTLQERMPSRLGKKVQTTTQTFIERVQL